MQRTFSLFPEILNNLKPNELNISQHTMKVNQYVNNKPNSNTSKVKSNYKFITKLVEILEVEGIKDIITWSKDGSSIEILDQRRFVDEVLPSYFKHNNISNFIRQLNMYNFKKVKNCSNPNAISYSNEFFKRGCNTLISEINRRHGTIHSNQSCLSISNKEEIQLSQKSILEEEVPSNKMSFIFSRLFDLENKVKTLYAMNDSLFQDNTYFSSQLASKTQYISRLESLIFFIINHILPNNIIINKEENEKGTTYGGYNINSSNDMYNKILLDFDNSTKINNDQNLFNNYHNISPSSIKHNFNYIRLEDELLNDFHLNDINKDYINASSNINLNLHLSHLEKKPSDYSDETCSKSKSQKEKKNQKKPSKHNSSKSNQIVDYPNSSSNTTANSFKITNRKHLTNLKYSKKSEEMNEEEGLLKLILRKFKDYSKQNLNQNHIEDTFNLNKNNFQQIGPNIPDKAENISCNVDNLCIKLNDNEKSKINDNIESDIFLLNDSKGIIQQSDSNFDYFYDFNDELPATSSISISDDNCNNIDNFDCLFDIDLKFKSLENGNVSSISECKYYMDDYQSNSDSPKENQTFLGKKHYKPTLFEVSNRKYS